MQTERVTFLTSPDHKAALDAFAKDSGMSVGHVVREATRKFIAQPANDGESDDEAELAALVVELASAVPAMRESLERSAKIMRDTSTEVDRMLRDAGVRK